MSFNLLIPPSLASQTGYTAVKSRWQAPSPSINSTDVFYRKALSAPRVKKWNTVTEARLCDTESLKNTIPYHQSKHLLKQLTPFMTPEIAELSRRIHHEALKKVLLVGSQLLDEQDRLSRRPLSIPGVVSIHPASVVLYREQDGQPPDILHTIPDMEPRPFTWPFRQVANITKDWASDKSPFTAEFGINLLMQGMAALNDIATQGPISILCGTVHLAENSLLGNGQLAFSAPEIERLKASAFKHGYNDNFAEFLPKVYQYMNGIAQQIEENTNSGSDPSLKLGIAYRDPLNDKKPTIKDVSALFPGCDLNTFLPEAERLRDYFEDIYYKS